MKYKLNENFFDRKKPVLVDPDLHSEALWIRIRIPNTHKDKIEAKDLRFTILFSYSKKKLYFKENCLLYNFFIIFSFKIDNTNLDPDPNWAEILDRDPNSMYLDPQHWNKLSFPLR